MRNREDFTGITVDRLTVLRSEIDHNGKSRQICRCTCGKEVRLFTYRLKEAIARGTASCGCHTHDLVRERFKRCSARWNKERFGQRELNVEPGEEFGLLTVLHETERDPKSGRRRVMVQCKCGTVKPVVVKDLLAGSYRSCGCYRATLLKEGLHSTHRHWVNRRPSPEYQSWNQAKQRCHNPLHAEYGKYGAKGIRMCERWLNSFEAFLEDMGPRPHPDMSLDRIDNTKGYEPGNCRWATKAEQAKNRQMRSKAKKIADMRTEAARLLALADEFEASSEIHLVRRKHSADAWEAEMRRQSAAQSSLPQNDS
jgi:hypothetical protein